MKKCLYALMLLFLIYCVTDYNSRIEQQYTFADETAKRDYLEKEIINETGSSESVSLVISEILLIPDDVWKNFFKNGGQIVITYDLPVEDAVGTFAMKTVGNYSIYISPDYVEYAMLHEVGHYLGYVKNVENDSRFTECLSEKEKALNKYVRFLFFTGGEPTLNLDAIKFTITKVIEYNITIAYVSLITNGKSISNEYIDFVNSCEFFMTYVSQDKYHDKLTDYDYSQLSKLKRVSALKDFLSDDSDVIKKGRAEYNNLGVSQTINSDFMFSRYKDNLLLLSKLLCTCNGDILTTCDYSFNDTDSVKFCNYDDDIIKLVIDKSVNYELKVLEHTSKGDKMYKFLNG